MWCHKHIAATLVVLINSIVLSGTQGPRQQHPAYDYDYYDYYYDQPSEAAPPPRRGSAPARGAAAADQDYDLAELVKAWKEYIKEKAKNTVPQKVLNYECPPREESYRIPHPTQCDKFTECNIKGEKKVLLCPDGLVFDIKSEHCDYPAKVNCSTRPDLQEPQPSKNCPRANGFFPFPANESCQKFWDCREGNSYLQVCPAGVIFDPAIATCVTPDQVRRPDCLAGKVLGFQCPQYSPEAVLKFGNHDRLPHPDDCQKFYACLKTGQPRLSACPKNTVFNNATGHCADPASVPGCENFWKDKEKEEYEYYDG